MAASSSTDPLPAAGNPATTTVTKKSRKSWIEPENYRASLRDYVTYMGGKLLQQGTPNILCLSYAQRPDRALVPVKTVTGEICSLLKRFNGAEWPLWPTEYVPCGPDGRALHYMCKAELDVFREIFHPFVEPIRRLLDAREAIVMGSTVARLFAGIPELRQYVVAGEGRPGSGIACVPYPCEWHKMHGKDLEPLHNKLQNVFGPDFVALETFERQINAAYRRVRVSVGIWVHANVPEDKKTQWRRHITEAMRKPETFAKLSEAKKIMYINRPELREQVGDRARDMWANDKEGLRGLITEAMARPEVKTKQCTGIAEKWKNEEWSSNRRQQMAQQGADNFASMKENEKSKPDSYHRAKSDAISKAKRKKNAGGAELEVDNPIAMRLHVPLKLTDENLKEVFELLSRRHEIFCIDPQDKYVFWAICNDGNLRRGSRAVRTLLNKFEVTRTDLPNDWQSQHPPSSMPNTSTASYAGHSEAM